MQPILSVRDVVKHFGAVKAVDGITFDVRRGTITGLLGRNGAGKTTTIRMITGIFFPDRGTIELHTASEHQDHQDLIGYLPEERGLYKQMKVMDLLLFFSEIKGKRPASIKPAAEQWLRRFELWEKRDSKVEELSKGNAQKIQLIATLLHDPELLILDEPMSGLDPVNVVVVRELLRELKEQGKTILLSTHMMGEAERLADDIVLIHGGRIVLSGDLDVVRKSFGKNSIQLEFEGDGRFLAALPGVARGTVLNNSAELSLDAAADPQALLQSAMAQLRISRYEIASPSLEEIFIEQVGTETLSSVEQTAQKV